MPNPTAEANGIAGAAQSLFGGIGFRPTGARRDRSREDEGPAGSSTTKAVTVRRPLALGPAGCLRHDSGSGRGWLEIRSPGDCGFPVERIPCHYSDVTS